MGDAPSGLRFAVLYHTKVAWPHFDVLLEISAGEPLLTLKAERWPLLKGDRLAAQPEHRRVYLDYEGEIAGGRGSVRRVAGGACRWETRNAREMRFVLEEQGLSTRLTLVVEGAGWGVAAIVRV